MINDEGLDLEINKKGYEDILGEVLSEGSKGAGNDLRKI